MYNSFQKFFLRWFLKKCRQKIKSVDNCDCLNLVFSENTGINFFISISVGNVSLQDGFSETFTKVCLRFRMVTSRIAKNVLIFRNIKVWKLKIMANYQLHFMHRKSNQQFFPRRGLLKRKSIIFSLSGNTDSAETEKMLWNWTLILNFLFLSNH